MVNEASPMNRAYEGQEYTMELFISWDGLVWRLEIYAKFVPGSLAIPLKLSSLVVSF
jgi:hypothetical protein